MIPAQRTIPAAATGGAQPTGAGLIVAHHTGLPGALDVARKWASAVDRTAFILLLLSVGLLIVRPADLFPVLEEAPVYEVLMAACIACALPRATAWLRNPTVRANAVVSLGCFLAPAVVLSHLSRGDTWDARVGGLEMAKQCALFLLLVNVLDSPARLRGMLLALVGSVFAVAVLSLLQYHGLMSLPAPLSVTQRALPDEGPVIVRLCGIGVFNDPNDFALILVVAILACGYWITDRRAGRWRAGLLGVLGTLGYAFVLTHSRGGLIALVAAGAAFVPARIGWRNAIPLVVLAVPLLVMAPGRQAELNLDNPEDTFQMRLELWSRSLDLFRSAPLTGIGQGQLVERLGQVAHNSYLQAFAELGFFGGAAFLGVFLLTLRGLWAGSPAERESARLRPIMLAMVAGYAAGLLSLSRCYTATTQLVLGIAGAHLGLVWRSRGTLAPALDARCMARIAAAGAGFLILAFIFVRLATQGDA
jgi:O-antigen ligase